MHDSEAISQQETRKFTTQEILKAVSTELPRHDLAYRLQVLKYAMGIVVRKKYYNFKYRHRTLAKFINTFGRAAQPLKNRRKRLAQAILPAFGFHIGLNDVLEYIIMFVISLLTMMVLHPH